MQPTRVAVIGAGHWGPNLIRNFSVLPHSTVTAVVDTNPSRLRAVRERYPAVEVTDSANAVLHRDDIDAVVLCTPTKTHFKLARSALESKKHVFVEKPMATTAAECRTLEETAGRTGRLLFVGHVFVYNAGIRAVKRYIESGELGDVNYLHFTRENLGPVRADVSALWDLAPHDLSIIQFWMGRMPESVSAVGGYFLNAERADSVFATYRFGNGVLANLHVSWLSPRKVREAVVVGNRKMLVWSDMNLTHPLTIYDKRVVLDAPEDEHELVDTYLGFRGRIAEGDTVVPKIDLNEPLYAECEAFLKAIGDPTTCVSGSYEGRVVVEALEATEKSICAGGSPIPIP